MKPTTALQRKDAPKQSRWNAAGVDMSTPEPVQETFGVLSAIVDRLESLVASV